MPSTLIAEAITPDGESITLNVEGADYVVRIRGELLMSSRQAGSEEEMASIALQNMPAGSTKNAQILIGGLGIGFTLRAVLDLISPNSSVTVVELIEEVVDWNRGVLAPCANHPLDDSRVSVKVGDIVDYLLSDKPAFDAIVLDIDNGPEAFTVNGNNRLYSAQGLSSLYNALRPSGVMVLWSAFKSPSFEKKLKVAGFVARSVTVRARTKARKGARHTLFVATRSS